MSTVSNVYDILNREPAVMAIHEDACRKKIGTILHNVSTKKRLNAAERELTSEAVVVIDTKERRDDFKRHLRFGSFANLVHRLIHFDETECCITCGDQRARLTRSHIGATRPELISRAVDAFKHRGRATLGEIATEYLRLHETEPIAPQCAPCHRTFERYQREWMNINSSE